jgi:hypothetical protein
VAFLRNGSQTRKSDWNNGDALSIVEKDASNSTKQNNKTKELPVLCETKAFSRTPLNTNYEQLKRTEHESRQVEYVAD